MAKTAITAELIVSALTGKSSSQCKIVGAEFDPSTGLIDLEIEGVDVPAADRVTGTWSTISGIGWSGAVVFNGFKPVE